MPRSDYVETYIRFTDNSQRQPQKLHRHLSTSALKGQQVLSSQVIAVVVLFGTKVPKAPSG